MRQPNLSAELLRTFVTINDTGGFIRAAEHLHKTQSTVSQHVKRLEQEVQSTLFSPDGRSRVLTPAGEIFLGYARRMLALQDEAIIAVTEPSAEEEVRLGVSHSLSEGVLPEILGQFTTAYPNIRMEVETGFSADLLKDFDSGEYDLILTMETQPSGGQILGSELLVWIGREGFEWSPARPLPFASYGGSCPFRQLGARLLDQAGIPWKQVYSTNSLSGLMAAVRAGLAVTVRAKNAVSAGTEILTPRIDLPKLPHVEVVLRHRASGKAIKRLAKTLMEIELYAA